MFHKKDFFIILLISCVFPQLRDQSFKVRLLTDLTLVYRFDSFKHLKWAFFYGHDGPFYSFQYKIDGENYM